jgi:antirestriction protein ArdC
MSNQNEIRERISNEIVAALEKGVPPWVRPWACHANAGLPVNALSQRRYSGVNVLLLELHRLRLAGSGVRSKHYATFNQWHDLGCRVKPRPNDVPSGRWGCNIIYCRPVKKVERAEDGGERETEYLLLRNYTVFCADQVDGEAAERLRVEDAPAQVSFIDYAPAEHALAATGADIRHGGEKAFYRRPTPDGDGDFIVVPHKRQFDDEREYYATLLHEVAGHWTEHRLGWTGSYAEGELRAEMTACFAMTELGVPHSSDLSNHAAYLGHWLKAMREDPRFIFRSSADASRAVDFFLAFSSQQSVPETEETALA